LFINASIVKPRYSSQTKERLTTESKSYGTSWECSDKFIKKILTLEVIQSILDWVKVKEQAQENAELRKHNKIVDKADPKSVDKFHDASTKFRSDATLFLVEGDSALRGVLSGRNPNIHGAFALRGKPINVYEMDIKEVILNREFKNILIILGLQLGVKVNHPNDLRFSQIVIQTDQDLDGFHIRGLLFNMFHKYWPELYKLGMIYVMNTPLIKVTQGKKVIPFYSQEEFYDWEAKHKDEKYTSKYYKGLGTSTAKEWKEYFDPKVMEQQLVQLVIENEEDTEMFKLIFGKEKGQSDLRKEWLGIGE
jgi:DNA topoisomerase-2